MHLDAPVLLILGILLFFAIIVAAIVVGMSIVKSSTKSPEPPQAVAYKSVLIRSLKRGDQFRWIGAPQDQNYTVTEIADGYLAYAGEGMHKGSIQYNEDEKVIRL